MGRRGVTEAGGDANHGSVLLRKRREGGIDLKGRGGLGEDD
jgi:hypothetical protein